MTEMAPVTNLLIFMFNIAELNAAKSHEVLVSYAGDMKPLVSGGVAPYHVAVTLVTLTICLGVGAAVYYFRKRRYSTH